LLVTGLQSLRHLDVDVADLLVLVHGSKVVAIVDRVAHALGALGGFQNLSMLVRLGIGKRSGCVK
jgi:hypothetical protein